MKREVYFFSFLLFLSCLPLSGESLAGIFRIAGGVNRTALFQAMDISIARMRFEKETIEARDEQAKAAAESTFLQALITARRSLQTYYHEVIDAIFNAAEADIARRTALLALDSAREEQAAAEAGHPRGRTSAEALSEARLAFRNAALDHEQSVYQFEEYREELKNSTGLEWNDSLLPSIIPALNITLSQSEWIAADPAVRRAVIAERIASIRSASLLSNASRYDRQLVDVELEKARLGVIQAQTEAERSYRNIVQRAKSQYASLAIRREQLENQESLARDSDTRFRRGLISSIQRNQEQARALTARTGYYRALRTCLKTLFEYITATDGSAEDLK